MNMVKPPNPAYWIPSERIDWIPVERKLPDDEATVLVYTPAADPPVGIGFLDGGYWRWQGNAPIQSQVTHWAKLPKGPA